MFENIRLAFQGIWSHKMRSFLTMLGIIIGIASIIAIVSTIKGTSEQIKENLIGSGNNTVNITLSQGDSAYSVDSYSDGSSVSTPLLSQSLKDEVKKADHVENATFFYSRTDYNSSVYYENSSFSGGKVYGIDMNYLDTCGYQVRSGRGFVQADYDGFRKVAMIDSYAADTMFPGVNPIGKIIEIGSEPYTVIGVVRQSTDSLPNMETPSDFDNYYESVIGTVLIPNKCWPISYKFDEPENAIIKVDSTDNMSEAGSAVAKILNKSIDNTNGKSSFKYKADDVMERVKNLQNLSESTNSQLIWIASISLLVGGIGVMNIMLVSVTERTKEIGLKKAIGARKKVILGQFLTEAAVLTSVGGIIGVVLGIGLSKIVSKVAGSPTAISVPAIVGSVVFSMLIGIIFGLLPSVKAANLNPIDALRSE
ncbi:ABC transporter permease [Blautia sp. HCP3S3_H10_1]|uniref:ABC transporter permease n=1 Tax=unclassified Blautia TaxID=2648079 RepID=UPI003F8DB0C4|nr:ABC transporter permease [Clostridia bacterium]